MWGWGWSDVLARGSRLCIEGETWIDGIQGRQRERAKPGQNGEAVTDRGTKLAGE